MPASHPAQKVLVVEDDCVIAYDLCTQLEEAGYQVCGPAGRTETALEIIDCDTPDLALLDVNLGRGETSSAIARDLMARRIPFAFLSSYTRPALSPDFANIPILSKPCQFKTVQDMIERLVAA